MPDEGLLSPQNRAGGEQEDRGLWLGRARHNSDLTHLLIPLGGLRSDGFYSKGTGLKESCGWVPEPLGTRGEAGLSCSLATHPHHSPASLRFPFSISTPSDHHQQAQKRRGVSEPLTHRPQSSDHLHKGVEGWAGLCPGSLREEWQWEEETHTNPVFHLLDEQACHCQDGHTGVSTGVGFPPGGKGQAQGPDPKQGALGGQCGSDGQASGSVAQLLPPSTTSSMVGTWLDPMQDFWEPTPFPSFRMRLASLRVIWPGSHLGGPAYLPQVQLQHLGPRRAELEGEGTAVWEDCLRWGSLQDSGVSPVL